MKRLDTLDKLIQIQYNVETVEKQLASKMPEFYNIFSKISQWEHSQEIKRKALVYWKRRFNRELLKLGYKL